MEFKLKELDIVFREKEHTYHLNGELVPSVTTITGMLPKGEGLLKWAANEAVKCIGEHWKPETPYSPTFISDILELGKGAFRRKTGAAATRGTVAHNWYEQFIKTGMEPPMPEDAQIRNSIQMFKDWLAANDVKWVASEVIVASEKFKFAGKLDAIAVINGRMCLVDFKTGSGVYMEHFVQTSGYVIALEEMGFNEIQDRWILRFPKTGDNFEAVKVMDDMDDDKRLFLLSLGMQKSIEQIKAKDKARRGGWSK